MLLPHQQFQHSRLSFRHRKKVRIIGSFSVFRRPVYCNRLFRKNKFKRKLLILFIRVKLLLHNLLFNLAKIVKIILHKNILPFSLLNSVYIAKLSYRFRNNDHSCLFPHLPDQCRERSFPDFQPAARKLIVIVLLFPFLRYPGKEYRFRCSRKRSGGGPAGGTGCLHP